MTLHRYYRTAMIILACIFSTSIATASEPGEEVYKSLLYLWNQAPSKFSDIMSEEDWSKLSGAHAYIKSKYQTYEIEYDIPEFKEEEARQVKIRENEPTDYVISAKKFFTSDAECEEYYQEMLTRIPVLLASYGVRVKRYDDHVFYKDRQKTYYRKMYVKRYLSDKRDTPRVIVSVRVEFPEK